MLLYALTRLIYF